MLCNKRKSIFLKCVTYLPIWSKISFLQLAFFDFLTFIQFHGNNKSSMKYAKNVNMLILPPKVICEQVIYSSINIYPCSILNTCASLLKRSNLTLTERSACSWERRSYTPPSSLFKKEIINRFGRKQSSHKKTHPSFLLPNFYWLLASLFQRTLMHKTEDGFVF